jgi:hypothetical protein
MRGFVCKEIGGAGDRFVLHDLPALLFVIAMLDYYSMIREKEQAERNKYSMEFSALLINTAIRQKKQTLIQRKYLQNAS